MSSDIAFGDRSGVDLRAFPNGIYLGGWYDSFVGIEGGFVSWDDLEALRKKTRRRARFAVSAEDMP